MATGEAPAEVVGTELPEAVKGLQEAVRPKLNLIYIYISPNFIFHLVLIRTVLLH